MLDIPLRNFCHNIFIMDTLVDDVGSFPLPNRVDREVFDKAYVLSREGIINGKDIREDEFLLNSFYSVTLESFRNNSLQV
jgi:hypothetical protein